MANLFYPETKHDIEYYENFLKDFVPKEQWNFVLQTTLKQIEFLESIYMTGAKNNVYSQMFQDAAVKECQEKRQLSSACHSLLGEQNE